MERNCVSEEFQKLFKGCSWGLMGSSFEPFEWNKHSGFAAYLQILPNGKGKMQHRRENLNGAYQATNDIRAAEDVKWGQQAVSLTIRSKKLDLLLREL